MTPIPADIACRALAIARQHADQNRRRQQAANAWGTPLAMQQHLHPDYRTTPALQLLNQEITNTLDTPGGRLIISMPPQEGKTELVRAAVTAQLTRHPGTRVILGSYAQSLASLGGRAIRDNIALHPELGIAVDRASHSRSEWGIAGHLGGVVARGRGAGVSGRAADLLVIDDPLKEGEAASRAIRDECWLWWQEGLATRLSPGAPVVVVMTRWHQDDLAGRLATLDAHAGWRTINISAQCDVPDTDPLGRAAGEYMESARGRTFEQWEQRRRTAGSRTWNALYQGHPTPPRGGIFHRDWWRTWDELPPLDGDFCQSWDLTFTGGSTSDWVVGQVWERRGAHMWLIDQVRGHWTFTQTLDQIARLTAKWPQAAAKYVEAKANGPAVIDALHDKIGGIIPVTPRAGKTERANAVTPLCEAGNVHLPSTAARPWAGDLHEELADFPNGVHDDQVDALTQALSQYAGHGTFTQFHFG